MSAARRVFIGDDAHANRTIRKRWLYDITAIPPFILAPPYSTASAMPGTPALTGFREAGVTAQEVIEALSAQRAELEAPGKNDKAISPHRGLRRCWSDGARELRIYPTLHA